MAAMINNAKSIIAFHNHPSSDPTPSREDIRLTHRLQEAGKIMGIELLDHVITGEQSYVSLKEKGLITYPPCPCALYEARHHSECKIMCLRPIIHLGQGRGDFL
jgi:hypothetical protein